MADGFYFIEPLGNKSRESKFERCWNSFEGKYGLRTSRIIQFDPYTAMSRRPIKYILDRFEIKQELPDSQWISENLDLFIREEAMASSGDYPTTYYPEIDGELFLPDEYLLEFLASSEWEKLFKVELPKDDTYESMASAIYDLLCNPQTGSTKNATNNDRHEFVKRIIPHLERQKRLLFVLPGFPFKDQNRFRVPYSASNVDFGEISFMIRLHNLIQSLYQVHPFGAEAVVLSDGNLYADIFAVERDEVEEYQWRLRDFRNKLNIQGDVSIIELKDLIDRANENGEIERILSHIENSIRETYLQTSAFRMLIQGMKWNLNSKKLLRELDEYDAWSVIKEPREKIKDDLLQIWDEYSAKAETAAIKYASINLMLKWTDLIYNFFPESIRCTVHPKKDQFALAMNYAWNGVAWSEKWPRNSMDISTVPFYSLASSGKVNLVRFRSNGFPCFYTKEQYNQVFTNAQRVLKADGWNVDNVFGREFNIYDLDAFYELGKDDADFTWENNIMPESHFEAMLQFRINHYKKYGFGVHAVFQNGQLIGQMGLQVLNEQNNTLEFVIFLGKEYVNRGIGTKLLKYLYSRCKAERINTIYGVIRNDNAVAAHVVEQLGGVRLKTMAHYRQAAVLYEIKL